MAVPMLIGIAAVMLFTIVDTYFVGQLGSEPLAAMSFTFPITFMVMSVVMGIGQASSSVISRAIGAGDMERVRRLTTHSLLLALALVVIVAGVGLFTIDLVFGAMGATPDLIEMVRQYMVPWYLGVGMIVIPMAGNSAMRATGDAKTPMQIMIIAGVVNIALDPLFIFGIGPFPRLELQGAAIATVVSWVVTFVAAFWVLAKRDKMLELKVPRIAQVLSSWKELLYIGVPAAATNVLVPFSTAILTRIVSEHGHEAVAAFGVGNRVEALSLVGCMALATAVAPFMGQNFGARNCGRMQEGMTFAIKSVLGWGAFTTVLLLLGAGPIAAAFSEDPKVAPLAAHYMRLIPWSYGILGISLAVSSMFNAVNLPMRSAVLVLMRLFVFSVPLAYLGSRFGGLTGMFVGMGVGNASIGVLAYFVGRRFMQITEREVQPLPAT